MSGGAIGDGPNGGAGGSHGGGMAGGAAGGRGGAIGLGPHPAAKTPAAAHVSGHTLEMDVMLGEGGSHWMPNDSMTVWA